MGRARIVSLLRKAVSAVCVVCSLIDARAATAGSSHDQVGNVETHESWKDYLADLGITISPEWDADVFANAHGGIKQRAETSGLIRLGLDLDCYKIFRLSVFDNTDIHVEGFYPYGTDISDYVGDLAGVNDNYGYNSPRLNELWIQKGIPIGMLDCSVRTGLLAADEEFDVNDTASFFINSSFGAPLGLAGNAPIPVYPFAALAVRLDFSLGDPSTLKVTFRTGVFDGNSAAPTLGPFAVGAPASHSYNRHGVDFHLNPSAGLIFLNEFAFDFLMTSAPETPADGPGRWFFGPGHVVIGGFYASNQFENIFQAQLQNLGALEPPAQASHLAGDYAGYAIWEQKLYEDAPVSPNGLSLFGRGLLLPSDRNFVTLSAETGAVYKGLFRRQKDLQDSLGLGFAYNYISDHVRNADAFARREGFPHVLNFEFESVLEATYVYPVVGHWQLQPDLQWVVRPGAAGSYRNALVIGVRSTRMF
jgi:porin